VSPRIRKQDLKQQKCRWAAWVIPSPFYEYSLVNKQFANENGLFSSLIYPLKMVICHRFLLVYQAGYLRTTPLWSDGGVSHDGIHPSIGPDSHQNRSVRSCEIGAPHILIYSTLIISYRLCTCAVFGLPHQVLYYSSSILYSSTVCFVSSCEICLNPGLIYALFIYMLNLFYGLACAYTSYLYNLYIYI